MKKVTCRNLVKALLIGSVLTQSVVSAHAQSGLPCITCPGNQNTIGKSSGIAIHRAIDGSVVQDNDTLFICERILVDSSVGYRDPAGAQIFASFVGVTAEMLVNGVSAGSIAPPGMTTTRIAPAAGCGDAANFVHDLNMNTFPYTFTGNGTVQFTLNFLGQASAGVCANNVTASDQITVNVVSPTCDVNPKAPVCEGVTTTYTTTSLPAVGVVTHNWTISGCGSIVGPNNGATVMVLAGPTGGSACSYTLTDNSTHAASSGSDACPVTCSVTIPVKPTPTCDINPKTPVCDGATTTYTSTVSPAGGTVTHSWAITGCGSIVGANNGATVVVTAGPTGGTPCSYTLTDTISRDECPGSCTVTIPVNPNPTCDINPKGPVDCTSTTVFTSTVTPSGGTVTHSWSIISSPPGCATISGPTTGPSVTVVANCSPDGGSFTLVDVINRNGCPGECRQVVVVTPCPLPVCTVSKEVACFLPGNTCGTFGPEATGVKDGGVCPAFCYRVTIRNTGNVPLATLTVNDPVLGGNISGDFGPLPLNPGDSRTHTYSPITHCVDTPDTVTVVCTSAGGLSHTDEAHALAKVLNINIVCSSVLFSSMDMDNNPANCGLLLPEGFSGPVRLTVTLNNTGSSDLDVTTISGLPALVDCTDQTTPVVVALPIHIAAGGTVTIEGCFQHACPTALSFPIKAHAEANDHAGTLCVYSSTGLRISDDSSDSDCVCTITCTTPVTCRVTGGGQLIPGFVDQSCIAVNTTIFPFTSPNGLTIKKITHGGQLGAPFSHMDCGEVLGNPCIRGQWQHTRHYQGTANPRDVIDMDFHSQTPKGQYDSLDCACLGCCDPETGVFITPIVLNGICNPDDHKVCGPQPRPAPANAIIFSGVGKVTPTDDVRGSRAAQAEWVVFRVYIEDRSEPGGGHPGGAVEPADIYCFQAWKTGIKVSKKPDFTTISAAFRTALGAANCAFLESLKSGSLPIGTLPSAEVAGMTADIQDCGPLESGNQQIHPSTSATCTQ